MAQKAHDTVVFTQFSFFAQFWFFLLHSPVLYFDSSVVVFASQFVATFDSKRAHALQAPRLIFEAKQDGCHSSAGERFSKCL